MDMEDLEFYIEEAKDHMEKSLQHVSHALAKIRAGRALPSMLDGLMVEYYGNPTPINQVASITTPDARTLAIKPWEKNMVAEIERTIINSDLGLNPQNDGEIVRLNIPTLTEERRKDLVKQSKNEAEHGRISVRNVRKDANDNLKKMLKEHVSEDEVKKAESAIQELTDAYVQKIDELLAKKEDEIMTV
jgi:ribosome recycling factor